MRGHEEIHMFTEKEIELVRTSWDAVGGDVDGAAALFYGKLFAAAPAVRPMFPEDMKAQGQKLMQMIGTAVNNMERVEQIVPALEALGKRHVGYGALPDHYPVVGEVLLDTLATALGDDFTDEMRAAWAKTYGILSSVMVEAS
jgi:hemoglobin-like flavoprotein